MWVCLVMVLIALLVGLRPRGWSTANDARWLPDSQVIRFQNSGIAYVDDLRAVRLNRQPWPLTIEMAVTPAGIQKSGSSPILVLHDGADRRQLVIWQYGASLIVMNGDDFDNSRRRPRVVGRNAFAPRQTSYLTVTSGEQGTRLYVDGILADAKDDWKLSIPVEGNPLRLVLGHSVYGKYGWSGDMHGLAITGEALSAEMVKRRFDCWAADRTFDFLKQEPTTLLFTFSQKTDAGFVDESGGNQTLEMSTQMTALKKKVLSPAWRHLNWSRAVVGDIAVNLVGFMPLGIVFYGLLQCFSGPIARHEHLLAVILCMLLSLGIELAQAWIPTRSSSLLDLILNTFGAWLGIVVWKLMRERKSREREKVDC
jgi:VanZ family protein